MLNCCSLACLLYLPTEVTSSLKCSCSLAPTRTQSQHSGGIRSDRNERRERAREGVVLSGKQVELGAPHKLAHRRRGPPGRPSLPQRHMLLPGLQDVTGHAASAPAHKRRTHDPRQSQPTPPFPPSPRSPAGLVPSQSPIDPGKRGSCLGTFGIAAAVTSLSEVPGAVSASGGVGPPMGGLSVDTARPHGPGTQTQWARGRGCDSALGAWFRASQAGGECTPEHLCCSDAVTLKEPHGDF